MRYEICYLIGESREADLENARNEVKDLLVREGGELVGAEVVEKRKMAYKIKRDIKGVYIARRFDLPEKDSDSHKSEAVRNITRAMNLNQSILRFIVVRAEDLPELKEREGRVVEKKYSRTYENREKNFIYKKPNLNKKEKTETDDISPKIPDNSVVIGNKEELKKDELKMEEVKKEESQEDEINKKLDEILKI